MHHVTTITDPAGKIPGQLEIFFLYFYTSNDGHLQALGLPLLYVDYIFDLYVKKEHAI